MGPKVLQPKYPGYNKTETKTKTKTHHPSNGDQNNQNLKEKRQSTDRHTKVTEMWRFADKNFKGLSLLFVSLV